MSPHNESQQASQQTAPPAAISLEMSVAESDFAVTVMEHDAGGLRNIAAHRPQLGEQFVREAERVEDARQDLKEQARASNGTAVTVWVPLEQGRTIARSLHRWGHLTIESGSIDIVAALNGSAAREALRLGEALSAQFGE